MDRASMLVLIHLALDFLPPSASIVCSPLAGPTSGNHPVRIFGSEVPARRLDKTFGVVWKCIYEGAN